MKKALASILLLYVIAASSASAATLILGENDTYPVPIEILIDRTRTLTFDDVRGSKQFVSTDKTAYGFIKDVVWTKFTVIIPEGNRTEWFLEIGYPLLNKINIFIPGANNEYTVKEFGNKLPFSKRDIDHHNFLIRLNTDPGTYTYYLRFQSDSSMNIPMSIHSLAYVISDINIQKTVFGLFYGALLILLLYNLLLAISMRDLTYLAYAAFIISMILVSLELNGYGFQYIWQNQMWMNDMVPPILFLTNFTLTLFSTMYINWRWLNKTFQTLLFAYLGIVAALMIVSIFLPYHIMIMIGAGIYIPGISLVVLIGIYLILKKKREAYFYSLAFSFLFAGVVVTVNNRFGLLPNNFITLWGFQIGTVFSISLFSLGLADRVNILTRNLQEINIHLEDKVQERTKELSQAKNEIEAAMEEMEAINERLTNSNRELEQSQTIYKKDMSMATHLQSALLPKQPPQTARYDIALVYIPKSGVSGDFYDFYLDGDELIGAGIFDVSGHGIAPGLITLMAKSIVATTFSQLRNESLSTVVEKINEKLITEIRDIDNYLTGVLLRFKDDMIEYLNCAHPDVICRKMDIGRTGKVLDKTGKRVSGPFLGIDHSMSRNELGYQGISFKLKKNDCILMYTDSLSESQGPGGKEYGENRIIESLQKAPAGTAQEILNRVLGDFYAFLSSMETQDDLTVMLIRMK
ncbi:MAG: SpoIIE family protein phosphatase [Spirochaetes bacterium]|nr:SpoIIE family protein phosphatase [Spirochaetota bacterium]